MNDLFHALAKCLASGEDAVLVTVVASQGSTPRGAGAHMLVSAVGPFFGTIGGGAIEYRCQQLAGAVLASQKGQVANFTLAPNEVADLGMICGGNAQVLLQFIPATAAMMALCQGVGELLTSKKRAWLVADMANPAAGLSVYHSEGWLGRAIELPQGWLEGAPAGEIFEERYYLEPLVKAGTVFVFGGGHVAQALVPILEGLNFDCVVFEDRADFLTTELFPKAQLVLGEFEQIANWLDIGPADYALVMTRGHQYDFLLQKQLLATPARYIGVMGSKRKIAVQLAKLQEAGFEKEALERLTMPIGLAIQAETPAELAISIAGQLIRERATKC